MSKRDDTQEQENPKFEGFDSPTRNYFPMPNIWIEICAKIKSLAEIKVVQYVLRHTWGYQEYGITKAITTDEFMLGRKRRDGSRMDSGTGLSNRAVITALADAVKSGYLVCDVDDSDKGRIVKSYALNMKAPDEGHTDEVSYEKSSHLNKKSDMKKVHRGMKEIHSHREKSSYRTEKETVERNLEKDKDTAQSPNGSVLPSSPSPVSTHKEGRPRPTEQPPTPETPKQECPKKPFIDPSELQRVMDAVDRAMGAKMIWSDSRIKKGAKDLVEMGATDEQIETVISSLKRSWYKDKITMTLIKEQWPARLSASAISIPADTPTQEDKHSRYDDPDFDPRTLSNTESIEYKAWLAAHEPIKS